MNLIFFCLVFIALGIAAIASFRKGSNLSKVKGRPPSFRDFYEPEVRHHCQPYGNGRYLHTAESNGVTLTHVSKDRDLDARSIWYKVDGVIWVGVELLRDGQVIAGETRHVDA